MYKTLMEPTLRVNLKLLILLALKSGLDVHYGLFQVFIVVSDVFGRCSDIGVVHKGFNRNDVHTR